MGQHCSVAPGIVRSWGEKKNSYLGPIFHKTRTVKEVLNTHGVYDVLTYVVQPSAVAAIPSWIACVLSAYVAPATRRGEGLDGSSSSSTSESLSIDESERKWVLSEFS